MRALEQNTGQEIQTLQKAVVNRFEKSEEIIKFDDQEQKVKRQNLTSLICKNLRDSFPHHACIQIMWPCWHKLHRV